MRQIFRLQTPAVPRPAALIGRIAAVILLVSALGALVRGVMDDPAASWAAVSPMRTGMLALAVAVAVAVAVAMLVRHRHRARVDAGLEFVKKVHLCSPATHGVGLEVESGAVGAESVQVRSLRAHVRNLEETLEQETARAEQRLSEMEAERQEAVGQAFRRVRATIRGLGVSMADDERALTALTRVDAAIGRLTPTSTFERPVLSTADVAYPVSLSGQLSVLSAAAGPDAGLPVEQSDDISATEGLGSDRQQVEMPELVKVLPVPAPASAAHSQRSRRRMRRVAA